jgi:Ca-activated chloride channel family protein
VQQAIVRMFLRLRAPRIARAEVAWPGVPRWVTPLPTGLFGGETLHVYAGFAAPPQGAATLTLVPAGPGQVLGDTVALPTAVLDAPSLPRMAAALRIESAGKDEALALALRHQLLTAQTNCVIVHERAEGEKATDLPQLQKIAQMHAAGWGGMGTVFADAKVSRCVARAGSMSLADVSMMEFEGIACDAVPRSPGPFFDECMPMQLPESEQVNIEAILAALDALYAGPTTGGPLPTTIAGLLVLGVDSVVGDYLRSLSAAGHGEELVVRVFLAALLPQARSLGVSRQLQRALRNLFTNATEHAELRREVLHWLFGMSELASS